MNPGFFSGGSKTGVLATKIGHHRISNPLNLPLSGHSASLLPRIYDVPLCFQPSNMAAICHTARDFMLLESSSCMLTINRSYIAIKPVTPLKVMSVRHAC